MMLDFSFLRRVLTVMVLSGAGTLGARAQTVPPGEGLVADSTELRVLREFYQATGGPGWTTRTNWGQGTTLAEAGTWYGVTVDAGDVYALGLPNNGLTGELPAALGELRGLQLLYLNGNALGGELPAALADLTRLIQCWLQHNQLRGGLTGLLDRWAVLQDFDASHNRFTGPLPAAPAALPRLSSFDVGYNAFDGPLPAALADAWPALWHLGLAHNRFTGPIPGAWGRLGHLGQLFLDFNQLSGSVPDNLADITYLQYLCASHNRLTGPLPAAYKRFHQLYQLDLSDNDLSGPLPDSLKAYLCYLHNNRLGGEVPASYGTTRNGVFLLDHNEFTRIPYFPQPLGWPHLQLGLTNNYLAFDSYEPNQVTPGVYQFWDYGQRTPGPADTLQALPGQRARLDGRIGGAHNVYQWLRQVGGQWTEVPGQTGPMLELAAVKPADVGLYCTRVTNTWVVGIELRSRAHYLDAVPYPPLARNLPDDANQGPTALTPALPLAAAPATAATDVNFVRTWTPRVALTDSTRVPRAPNDEVSMSTQYLDGLGRPVQTVLRQASPQGRDLVQPQAYDALGREPYQFLPYPAAPGAGPAGGYRPQALAEQDAFYRRLGPVGGGPGPLAPDDPTRGVARTGVAYAATLYEPSPLNRVAAQGAPGESWQLSSGHAQQRLERPNTAQDSVPRFRPGYDPADRDPGFQGYYAAGELWGVQTTDAQAGPGGRGYASMEWKDQQGQTVLKQAEASRSGTGNNTRSRWLRTAYAYDDFDRLRYVLQPEATTRALALGDQPAPLPASAAPFLFHYRYDGRGRQIAKQVPGQDDETRVVFDQLDRPVLSQDAAQRPRREWSWTKYDALGRVILSGLVARADAPDPASLQALADAATTPEAQYEQRTPNGGTFPQFYTTDQSFPRLGQQGFGPGQVLTAAYYDDYNFDHDAAGTPDAAYNPGTDAQFAAGAAPVADALRTTGLATRTVTRVLNKPDTDPGADWLTTTTFYDERARPVQVQTGNARGGRDLLTTQLDFTGKVTQSVAVHQGPNHAPVQVAEFFAYDHTGRLLSTRQQLPGEAQPTLLARVAYNEIGQALSKTLGTGRLTQQVDYAYNIRGWLTDLNNAFQPVPQDLFNLSLHYERGFSSGYEQFNGNLTGQTWRGRDGVQRAYGYVYDPLSRLLQGDFVARAGGAASTAGAWNAELDNYRLSFVSYDDNGNIATLRRRGLLVAATRLAPKRYGPVDLLTYAYAGNRLQAVDDQVRTNQSPRPPGYNGAPTSLAGDFQEGGTHLAQEYTYDPNGSVTADLNKGLTGVAYNHLNLPRQVHFGVGADSVVFRYAASGQKVAKLVYQTGRPVQRTDYLGPFQYEGDSLRFFPHAEGRVLRFVSTDAAGQPTVRYEREFSFKDHLGNLRAAYRLGHVRTLATSLNLDDAAAHAREARQFDSLSVSAPVAQRVGPLARSDQFAARLNAGGSAPQPLGPLAQVAVQRGDTVTVTAYGLYAQPVQHNFFFALASFLAGVLHPAPGAPPGPDPARGRAGLPLLQVGVAAGLAGLPQLGGGVPRGYLRVLVFGADSALVGQYVQPLSAAARNSYEALRLQVRVPQDGYVTAYVGNESDVDVLFDDVTVEHRPGLQVQETQYDPYGLSLAGLDYSSPGLKPLNQYQFNGKERQNDLGLGWSDYGARFYSNDAPHWTTIDPLAEKMHRWSPYAFSFDNPLRFIDTDGRSPGDATGPSNRVDEISYNKEKNTYTVSETTTTSSSKSKVTTVDGPVPMKGRYFKETTTTNTTTIKSVAEINAKGKVLNNSSTVTQQTTQTVKIAQTKAELAVSFGMLSGNTENTKQDNSLVGPMSAAISYGLSNFGPAPPVINDAQFRDKYSPDPVGAPDGATPGYGSLGSAIIDALTGRGSSFHNMSGTQPDAGSFVGGQNSSSYKVYEERVNALNSKSE